MYEISLRKFIHALILVCAVGLLASCSSVKVPHSYTHEPVKLHLAGVSFTGDYALRHKNYPNSLHLAQGGRLDRAFVEELSRHQFTNVVLTTDLGESTHSSDSLAVSLGINLETVTIAHIKDIGYKTVADIYAELLIFDFDTKKITTTLPINMQYITVTQSKPTRSDIQKYFRAMILGTDPSVKKSLLQLAADKLSEANIQRDYGARYKVSTINLTPRAEKTIEGLGLDTDQFKTITAQMLTRSMVDNLHVAVVPYTKGEAIGSKMPARFANGDAFTFELPPADYAFEVRFNRFEVERDVSNEAIDVEGYYVFLNIIFEQPDLAKRYLERNFMASATTTVVKNQETTVGVAFMETIFNFFESFARNVEDVDAGWIKSVVHPDNVSATKTQINEVHRIMTQ